MIQYAFDLRFRTDDTELRYSCAASDALASHAVRRMVEHVASEHPKAQFDGMTCRMIIEVDASVG